MYTVPVSKANYLGGRFLAAFTLNTLLLLAVPAGLLLGFYSPGSRAQLLGPFRPEAYLSAFGLLALPVALVGTTVQFGLAVLRGRAIASYVGSVLLFFASHFILMIVAKLVGWWDLVKLLDLVGFGGVVGSELETWTEAEKNTRLIALQGLFLWNRLLWLGFAGGFFAFVYHRFQLTSPAIRRGWSWRRQPKRRATAPTLTTGESRPIMVPPVARPFGWATYAYQTLAVAWSSYGKMARSWGGLPLVAAIALGSALLGSEFMQQNTIPLFPTTQQVVYFLTNAVGDVKTPWIIIPLLIVYFAGELVWREREAGLSEITDTAPVPEWVLLGGKFLGLGLLLVTWMALLLLGGMLLQIILGYQNFEVGLYLKTLFGLQLIEYLLFALLALVVHVLVNQKYVGHLALLLTLGFIGFASKLGIHHHLLVFGAAPDWAYTDIRGFRASLGPWFWFKGYWTAWALLLAVVARLVWTRGRESSLRQRLQRARRRVTFPTAVMAAVAVGLVLTLGGFIFYNTNGLNEYTTAPDLAERLAEYERRYGRYVHVPQPQPTSTKLHVELYPARQAVSIRGSYQLMNYTAKTIDSIHLATALGVETADVSFSRPAAQVLADEKLGHRIYRLATPLRPGDSLQLSFRVQVQPRGFRNNGVHALVEANGTYFMSQDVLPSIGYQPLREHREASIRKKYNLPSRPEIPSLYDAKARQKSHRGAWGAFEAVVGTALNQTAVAPGALHRTWTAGGRRYFHYKTDAPIQNQAAFFSAGYAVRKAHWQSPSVDSGKVVSISFYYYPPHAANVERMVRSVLASLDHYSTQFGTYPYGHLTVVERAGNEGELNAEASTIDYGEQFALMKPDDGPRGFDLPYYVLAHEVAHQFGAGYASVEGAPVLAEGLAVYSGMQVLEKAYGYGHLRRYLSFLRQSYEVPRSRAMAPLLRANNAFLGYRKGPLALYALSQYIGQEQVNGALRRVLAKPDSATSTLTTTLDLYRELRAATPDSLHYLLRDLFETNTYWDLETRQATAKRTAAGTWQVTLDVRARKLVVDSVGAEHEMPLNDWVEIGVIAPRGKEEYGQPIYRQKHRIRSGEQTITVTVPSQPARAGIDPYLLLIDLKTDDNVEEVKIVK
ncbi:ABC transporter permease/M1 family aminopeptidase [Hymenobacter radiodurans]|uniref:ABC transporter permease/M1 family aminopeptidase n=1 Tax=Hymenobacter radiodurans TaxID=2496028 RepID=UPI00140451BD|nr:ABC transporter permease [Hymenobacter radiodurans]